MGLPRLQVLHTVAGFQTDLHPELYQVLLPVEYGFPAPGPVLYPDAFLDRLPQMIY